MQKTPALPRVVSRASCGLTPTLYPPLPPRWTRTLTNRVKPCPGTPWPFWIGFSTRQNFLEIHPGCGCVCSPSLLLPASFLLMSTGPWCGWTCLFNPHSLDGIWALSRFGYCTWNRDKHLFASFCVNVKSSFLWNRWPGVQLLGCMMCVFSL